MRGRAAPGSGLELSGRDQIQAAQVAWGKESLTFYARGLGKLIKRERKIVAVTSSESALEFGTLATAISESVIVTAPGAKPKVACGT